MRPLYITGRMGSGGEKKCCLFTQNMLHLTDSWNALTTAGAKQKKNGKEGRDEKRRKWEWSEEATHGSSFFSCHPFNCFLAVVTLTGLQGGKICANSHALSHTRAHKHMHVRHATVWQSCQGKKLKWPTIFRASPLSPPPTISPCPRLPLRQQ